MGTRLAAAFKLTDETHSQLFERFANAFLVDDYPELQGLGGKHDGGMDARLLHDSAGTLELVVQSCVSPSDTARTKVLATIKKLKKKGTGNGNGNEQKELPDTLVYCSSAVIGLRLDETKRELRRDHRVTLEVRDAVWFDQRSKTSTHRQKLSEEYAREVLTPLLPLVDPTTLYSSVLTNAEADIALRYLEAESFDRKRGQNLTKAILNAHIVFAVRDTSPPEKLLGPDEIATSIRSLFPASHAARLAQLIPPRIAWLTTKGVLKHHQQENRYTLAFPYRTKLVSRMREAEDRELAFRGQAVEALQANAEYLQIDYEYPRDTLAAAVHDCVIWFLSAQGKRFSDATGGMPVLNAEYLVDQYLSSGAKPVQALGEHIDKANDLLPGAIFELMNSSDTSTRRYLRAKADLFLWQAFLQKSPDVQAVCNKLFSKDIVYLDTTVLIRCLAERYYEPHRRTVLTTLSNAVTQGIVLRTFPTCINEVVSHLEGPILQEWANHYSNKTKNWIAENVPDAALLLRVFDTAPGQSIQDCVRDILGEGNCNENTIEFLKQEFDIQTVDLLYPETDSEHEEHTAIYGHWLSLRRRRPHMSEDRHHLLVRNDVATYQSILLARRRTQLQGPNFGHKQWLLTGDRVPWKLPKALGKSGNHSYELAMSIEYLLNFVATLGDVSGTRPPDEILPAAAILEETAHIPTELRQQVRSLRIDASKPRYLVERRIRDLVHELKTMPPDAAVEEIL